jgi:hypothetical protein
MYSWEEVKRAVERVEDARLDQELARAEVEDGNAPRRAYLFHSLRPHLEAFGAMLVGIYVAVMVLILNYLVFVWLFHVNFSA